MSENPYQSPPNAPAPPKREPDLVPIKRKKSPSEVMRVVLWVIAGLATLRSIPSLTAPDLEWGKPAWMFGYLAISWAPAIALILAAWGFWVWTKPRIPKQ